MRSGALTALRAWHAAVEAAALGPAAGQRSPQGLQGAQEPHRGLPHARRGPAGGPVQQCKPGWRSTALRALQPNQHRLLIEAHMPRTCVLAWMFDCTKILASCVLTTSVCECNGKADVSCSALVWSHRQDTVQNKERATPASMMERAQEAFDGNIKVCSALSSALQVMPCCGC